MRSLIVSMICAAAMMLSGCALSGPGACNNGCGGMLQSGGLGGGCGDSCGCQSSAQSSGGGDCQSCGGGGMPCGFESLALPSSPMNGAYGVGQDAGCNTGCAPNVRAALPPIGAGFQALGLGRPQGARMGIGCGRMGCGLAGKLCSGCGLKSRLGGVRAKLGGGAACDTCESAPIVQGGGGYGGGMAGCSSCGGAGCGACGGAGGLGSGVMDHLSAKYQRFVGHEPHPYSGAIPHTNPMQGPGPGMGGGVPSYAYPYYTTRGPRDFLDGNPPSIGY